VAPGLSNTLPGYTVDPIFSPIHRKLVSPRHGFSMHMIPSNFYRTSSI
jgi:hypothetical protein